MERGGDGEWCRGACCIRRAWGALSCSAKRIESGKEVIFTNVGNPQALGQPSTFNRRVLALYGTFPASGVPAAENSMPEDVMKSVKVP